MSYGRNLYYIYTEGEDLYLDGTKISNDIIDAFLYKILLTSRREELAQRLKKW